MIKLLFLICQMGGKCLQWEFLVALCFLAGTKQDGLLSIRGKHWRRTEQKRFLNPAGLWRISSPLFRQSPIDTQGLSWMGQGQYFYCIQPSESRWLSTAVSLQAAWIVSRLSLSFLLLFCRTLLPAPPVSVPLGHMLEYISCNVCTNAHFRKCV